MITRCLAALFGLGLGFLLLAAIPEPAKETRAVPVPDLFADAICRPGSLSSPGHAASGLDPDYVAGRQAIEARNWGAAIHSLSSAALRDTRNADIQDHLGFAYRSSGNLDLGFRHHQRALQLNPRHRRAHLHMGVAHLMTDRPAEAEQHLAALEQICLIPCDELSVLEREMAERKRRTARLGASR